MTFIRLASLLVFSVVFVGCTSQPWQFAELAAVKQAADPKNSTLPSYDLTAAQWVENRPLLINKDFNFGMAMSMEGVGVAIAAGMRINSNKELAAALADLPPLNLTQKWQAVAGNINDEHREKQVVIYALLYGQPQAQLRTIVEFHGAGENPERFVDISDWAPTTGENSWSANNGRRIFMQIDSSLTTIVDLLTNEIIASGTEQEFSLTGGEAVQRGRGYLVEKDETAAVIKATTIANTVLRLPSTVTTIRDYEPPPEF